MTAYRAGSVAYDGDIALQFETKRCMRSFAENFVDTASYNFRGGFLTCQEGTNDNKRTSVPQALVKIQGSLPWCPR